MLRLRSACSREIRRAPWHRHDHQTAGALQPIQPWDLPRLSLNAAEQRRYVPTNRRLITTRVQAPVPQGGPGISGLGAPLAAADTVGLRLAHQARRAQARGGLDHLTVRPKRAA